MPALFVLFAALVGFGIYWSFQQKRKRREALAAVAAHMGLQYSADDPFPTLALPFRLFRRGDGRGTENMIWGKTKDMEVRLFDYWYYVEQHNQNGGRSKSYSHFSCAVTTIAAGCPHITIERESFFSRLADAVGFRDIDFESEEFNNAYQVKSEDRRFASAFCDARMMEWLLATEGFAFEITGPYLMAYSKRLKPAELWSALTALHEITGRVPGVVYSWYPAGPAAAQ